MPIPDFELPIDTSRLIFDDRYMIRVPVIATKTELEMKIFGTVYTGDPDIDKGHMDEWVTVMWSIDRMVENSKKGMGVKVIKFEDSKKIYESIMRHLRAWRNYKEQGININMIPYDDLISLDEFANLIYEYVKYEYIEKPMVIESTIDSYFKELNFINKQNLTNIFSNVPKAKDSWRDDKDITIPTKEDFSKYFKG